MFRNKTNKIKLVFLPVSEYLSTPISERLAHCQSEARVRKLAGFPLNIKALRVL